MAGPFYFEEVPDRDVPHLLPRARAHTPHSTCSRGFCPRSECCWLLQGTYSSFFFFDAQRDDGDGLGRRRRPTLRMRRRRRRKWRTKTAAGTGSRGRRRGARRAEGPLPFPLPLLGPRRRWETAPTGLRRWPTRGGAGSRRPGPWRQGRRPAWAGGSRRRRAPRRGSSRTSRSALRTGPRASGC